MKALIQRVARASVEVEGAVVGRIDAGMLVLVGVAVGDTEADVRYLAEKIRTFRMFSDGQGKMNLSLTDVQGAALLVSQFTLLARTAGGRRPGFEDAAAPDDARLLFDRLVSELRTASIQVETGVFGAHMKVELLNDGPVTFMVDSRDRR